LESYLEVAELAYNRLESHPEDAGARRLYNYALQRIFGVLRMHDLDPWQQPFKAGAYTLTHRGDPRPQWSPTMYEFLPDDQLEVGGKYLTERVTRAGVGASLVAISKEDSSDYRDQFAMGPKVYYGVSAVARFRGKRCEIEFLDPLDVDEVRVAGHRLPLAADFTTPLAVLLTREQPQRQRLKWLIDPAKYEKAARISRMQPYDPNRIPLLMVHGLMDTPATWTPMLNALRADPVIRKKYQMWMFSYPSGYPYPYSASLLRKELDHVGEVYPGHKPVVYIGHSMGGVIGRLLLVESGDKVWNQLFTKPPEETALSRKNRRFMQDMLIFSPRRDISRAVFISAPHRGSRLAMGIIGRIGSRLVRTPGNLLEVANALKEVVMLDQKAIQSRRLPNSIDTLSPENAFVKATRDFPITSRVPFHTISGNRGRGAPPNCSDGVVPYSSSHLEGAQSELVVPSDHSAHQHPQTIQEVRRILRLHAGAPPPLSPPQTSGRAQRSSALESR
jgi:pimeloyl-ACP methyl ester carboxylesterase